MNALVDLFQTARQMRSFGIRGDLRLPVSSEYAQGVVLALFNHGITEESSVGMGAEIAVEFKKLGTVVLSVDALNN